MAASEPQSCSLGKPVVPHHSGHTRGVGGGAPPYTAHPHSSPVTESCPFCILNVPPIARPSCLLLLARSRPPSPSSLPVSQAPHPRPSAGGDFQKGNRILPLSPHRLSLLPCTLTESPWVTGPGNAAWSLRTVLPLSLWPFPFQTPEDSP